MIFKASLTAAINAADLVSVDGYEVESFSFHTSAEAQFMERCDGVVIDYLDQEIEIDDGQAFFNDTDGEEHEIILCVSRRLQQGDLR